MDADDLHTLKADSATNRNRVAPTLRQRDARKTERSSDVVTATPYAALVATLDWLAECRKRAHRCPLWHWLYFLPLSASVRSGRRSRARRLPRVASAADVGGQPARVPPAAARGRRADAPCRRSPDVDRKRPAARGRSCSSRCATRFIAADEARLALTEFHDIVYRDAPTADDVAPPPERRAARAATWERKWVPDDVLLFRYSALDLQRPPDPLRSALRHGVEGYPGLIVHGPLIATLLARSAALRELPDARRGALRVPRHTADLRHQPLLRRAASRKSDGKTVQLWAARSTRARLCDGARRLILRMRVDAHETA